MSEACYLSPLNFTKLFFRLITYIISSFSNDFYLFNRCKSHHGILQERIEVWTCCIVLKFFDWFQDMCKTLFITNLTFHKWAFCHCWWKAGDAWKLNCLKPDLFFYEAYLQDQISFWQILVQYALCSQVQPGYRHRYREVLLLEKMNQIKKPSKLERFESNL